MGRTLGAPGVVLDLETYNDNYNDYKTYMVSETAEHRGEADDATLAGLRAIGREMAALVADEYPEAVIWSLFTNLGSKPDTGLRTHDYLCRGLLEKLAEDSTPALLVDGGELPLGYYSPSADALGDKLDSFAARLQPFTDRFPRHLEMGATLAPYHEPDRLAAWAKEMSEQGGHVFQNAAEFGPLVEVLLRRCKHVWMYGGQMAHYVPFDPAESATTEAVHAMLENALRAR